jgi:hypothetical protein
MIISLLFYNTKKKKKKKKIPIEPLCSIGSAYPPKLYSKHPHAASSFGLKMINYVLQNYVNYVVFFFLFFCVSILIVLLKVIFPFD